MEVWVAPAPALTSKSPHHLRWNVGAECCPGPLAGQSDPGSAGHRPPLAGSRGLRCSFHRTRAAFRLVKPSHRRSYAAHAAQAAPASPRPADLSPSEGATGPGSTGGLPPVEDTPEHLQQAFGCAGVSFGGVGGLAVARLAAPNGSAATVLLGAARVTSYKAAMWHGGVEEVFYTRANEPEDNSPGPLRGGAVVSFPVAGRGAAGVAGEELAPEGGRWAVVGASDGHGGAPEVTLRLHSAPALGAAFPAATGLGLLLTVRLTPNSLTLSLGARNESSAPAPFAASVGAHVGVAVTRGAFLMGLEGSAYRGGAWEPSKPSAPGRGPFDWLLRPLTRVRDDGGGGGSGAADAAETPPGGQRGDGVAEGAADKGAGGASSAWLMEKSSEVGLGGPIDRAYRDAAGSAMVLLDRGKRRSFQLESTCFDDFLVRNPGEASGLRDWDSFVFVGSTRSAELAPGQSWEASFRIVNLGV